MLYALIKLFIWNFALPPIHYKSLNIVHRENVNPITPTLFSIQIVWQVFHFHIDHIIFFE